jgi:ketosteroid isomerase-like protein
MADTDRAQVLRRALEACIRGEVDPLPELFAQDVSGWSPNMLVTSLDELTETVADREDALTDVDLEVGSLDVYGNKGFVEYSVSAVFSGPFVIGADVAIEPNGRELLLGAAMVAEFTDGKISAFRNYFDEFSLLEQMLAP